MTKFKSIARIAGGKFGLYTKGTYLINVAKNPRALSIVIDKVEKAGGYILFTTTKAVYFTI